MPEVTVLAEPGTLAEIEEHCFSRIDVEVGGFLIGLIDEDGTHVRGSARALEAASGQTQLTITHADWDTALTVLQTDFPGMAIVGWYHSHPGFGCFLSPQDMFIQENFFSAPGQVALVVDPLAGRYEYFVVADGQTQTVAAGATALPAIAVAGEDKADLVVAAPPRRRVSPVMWGGIAAVTVVVAATAWILGNMQGSDAAQARSAGTIQSLNAEVSQLQDSVGQLQGSLAQAESALTATPPPEPVADPPASPSAEPTPTMTPGPEAVRPGDRVTVAVLHTIRPGDNWWDLSRRYLGDGTRYEELRAANADVRSLQPGQTVRIPLEAELVGAWEGRTER